jgi:hypothetical protein
MDRAAAIAQVLRATHGCVLNRHGLCSIVAARPQPRLETLKMTRALIFAAAVLLVGAHYTGNMKPLMHMLDIGLDTRYILYFAALPVTCFTAFMLLRD